MVWRALCALGLPCRLVKGQDIANGALFRKPCPQGTPGKERGAAPLLLVPGGNARLKARALGEKGRQAVRDYLAEGGRYLGFCGGAGLALSQHRSQDGLGLCPWGRAPYPERLHHLISGHAHMRVRSCMARDLPAVRPDFPKAFPDGAAPDPLRPPLGDEACALVPPHWRGCAHGHDDDCRHCGNCRPPRDDGHVPSLPVWWPGRFAPEADERVSILASYRQPDTDFWLADLPLSRIPAPVFEAWKDLYGVNVSADFLDGQPLMVAGNYGQGRYVLSYSHLETPDSHDANAWLAHLLRVLAGLAPQRELVPAWDLHRKAAFRWPDTPQTAPCAPCCTACASCWIWAWSTTSFSSAPPGSGAGAPACPARSATTCIRPCACSAACVPARTPWPPGTACAPASRPSRTSSCPAPRAICWPAACARPSPPPCPTPWTGAASPTSARPCSGIP
ncbi:BPL-N domain-containing protein [Desulfovibrio piger]